MEEAFSGRIAASPTMYTQFLSGLMAFKGPYYDLTINGVRGDQVTEEELNALRGLYQPDLTVSLHAPGERDEEASILVLSGLFMVAACRP